jgi:uncharacterized protein DUF1707
MTGPQDPAAAGRDRLRAGYADREQVIEALKAAFVQGMRAKDEFDARVSQALASLTHADLAALTPAWRCYGPGLPGAVGGVAGAWASRACSRARISSGV